MEKSIDVELKILELDDVSYTTTLTKKFVNRPSWNKPNKGDVLSSLPGTIMEVSVKPGEQVKKGKVLLIQEAMKMQNRILAPIAGIIAEIDVKEGDKIAKNHLMLKIDRSQRANRAPPESRAVRVTPSPFS